MLITKKQIIYQGAFLYSNIDKDITLTEFAYLILTDYGKLSSEEASDYVSKFNRSISNNLKKQNDELKKRGVSIIGNIEIGDRISWNSSNPLQNKVWKIRPIFLDLIDSLSDEKFEAFCCLCLNLIGGKVWRTKSKGDGNVDLYGIANTNMNNHIFGKNNKFRIVGQCKNYSHQESITNFESFFRALDNVKFLSPRVTGEMPNEFSRESGPIIGWYICKDGFQNGIFEEARKHGVVLSDKYDLVEILVNLQLNGISSFKTLCRLNFYKEIRKHV